ncbi:hypothetical protein FACS189443_1830 [Planctomycetales bacterium]|nr:hypothetical protein FACS189443_1830 [Planctomycetales bacterium]
MTKLDEIAENDQRNILEDLKQTITQINALQEKKEQQEQQLADLLEEIRVLDKKTEPELLKTPEPEYTIEQQYSSFTPAPSLVLSPTWWDKNSVFVKAGILAVALWLLMSWWTGKKVIPDTATPEPAVNSIYRAEPVGAALK